MPEYTYNELLDLFEAEKAKNEQMEADIKAFAEGVLSGLTGLGMYPFPPENQMMKTLLRKVPEIIMQSQVNPKGFQQKIDGFKQLGPFFDKYKHLMPKA